MLDKPQLPRPVAVVTGKTWQDIWAGIATLSKQNQNLVEYLQNYLTKVYHAVVPSAVAVSIVQTPYIVNATDTFIGAVAGPVTLPFASGSGRLITIKKLDASPAPVVVTPSGTDTIDGVAGVYNLGPQWALLPLIDGAIGQWLIF